MFSVSGLGYGVMSGAFSLANVISTAAGPGTIGLPAFFQLSTYFGDYTFFLMSCNEIVFLVRIYFMYGMNFSFQRQCDDSDECCDQCHFLVRLWTQAVYLSGGCSFDASDHYRTGKLVPTLPICSTYIILMYLYRYFEPTFKLGT